jgi:hypothetical protein
MPENKPHFGKITAKAWRDPAFKAELIAHPSAALGSGPIKKLAARTEG